MLTMACWYEPAKWRGRPMRISKLAGRGIKKSRYNWGEVRCLIPPWELVKAYRSGRVSRDEYTGVYYSLLGERWEEVAGWLDSLTTDEDLTLLCHEREGLFCHRWLVAALVKKHRPDIPVDLR